MKNFISSLVSYAILQDDVDYKQKLLISTANVTTKCGGRILITQGMSCKREMKLIAPWLLTKTPIYFSN